MRPEFATHDDCVYIFDLPAFLHRAMHVCYGEQDMDVPATDTRFAKHAANMLANVVSSLDVRRMVVTVDSAEPSFRLDEYEAYKANRKAHAPVFRAQAEHFYAGLIRAGVAYVGCARYEADDLIATLVAHNDDGAPLVIVTSDKDLWCHLRHEAVVIYDPLQNLWRDRAACVEKFGIEPSQLHDYLGLVGDSSDGIPGVPGVGAKTAAVLLGKLRSLEEVYAPSNRSALTSLLGKKTFASVIEHEKTAYLSRKLAQPWLWTDGPRLRLGNPELYAPEPSAIRAAMG